MGWIAVLVALLGAGPVAGEISFRRATEAWGAAFRHLRGSSGRYYFLEIAGAGVVVFDHDGDGDRDLFLVDSGPLPGYAGPPGMGSRLLRNDLSRDGGVRFVDVTDASGIAMRSYGMGAVAGDVDGDGDLDLVTTGYGPVQLFTNRGDGTFAEATDAAGLGDVGWSTGPTLADADVDGDLDLYVARYSAVDLTAEEACGVEEHGVRSYCHPTAYRGVGDVFYTNRGDGTFAESTEAAGFAGPEHRGLGAVFGDFDGDGAPDLYVANDTEPNLYFRNRGDGTFEEMGLLANVAVSDTGTAEGGMGVAVADVDGDLLLDLFVTNFELESNALYRNAGDHLYFDQRHASGLAEPSFLLVGFGTALADLDRDGDPDLVVANGHVLDNVHLWSNRTYKQPDQVFANEAGRFREVRGHGVDAVRASRGLATGDLDADGDLDLVVTASDDVAEAWENTTAGGRFLELDLRLPAGERHGVGSRATVTAASLRLVQEVTTGSSYLSQNDLSLHFGVGDAARADVALRLRDGRRLAVRGLPTGRRVRVDVPPRPAP